MSVKSSRNSPNSEILRQHACHWEPNVTDTVMFGFSQSKNWLYRDALTETTKTLLSHAPVDEFGRVSPELEKKIITHLQMLDMESLLKVTEVCESNPIQAVSIINEITEGVPTVSLSKIFSS